MAGIEASLDDLSTRVATLPRSMWRRRDTSLETLPGGLRLAVLTSPFVVRWATWLVAVLIVAISDLPHTNRQFEPWLLIGTFVQTVVVTFYVPVIRPVLLPQLRRYVSSPENSDVLALGFADLTVSMVAVWLSGAWNSPYYHFLVSALLIPAFFLTFRAVLVMVGVFLLAYVFGLATFGEGVNGGWKDSNLNSFIGTLVTPSLVALVPNYLGSVLRELEAARQRAVDALGESDLLFRVARAFLEGGRALDDAIPSAIASIRASNRFDSALVLLDDPAGNVRAFGYQPRAPLARDELARAFSGASARTIATRSLPATVRPAFADSAWVGVVALHSGGEGEGWLLLGASRRPASVLREVRLLDAIGGQIALGVRNIRLAERVAELAAEGERIRIAREIHDGIAQMVYMLSISLETAIDRVGADPEEQRRRLQDLTALAKHALWEVRQYIFDLQPLLSGDSGLIGAIRGQVREFESVSQLPVELRITGEQRALPFETSAALYRIVQEGLGNIFRHARASRVSVDLAFTQDGVALSIEDDGVGIGEPEGGRAGFGMGNLRSRVEALAGTIAVASAPGVGTRIDVRLPLEATTHTGAAMERTA